MVVVAELISARCCTLTGTLADQTVVVGFDDLKDETDPSYRGKTVSEWLQWLKSNDAEKGRAAVDALRTLGPSDRQILLALVRALKDKTVNRQVSRLFGMIGAPAVTPLIKGLEDENDTLRAVAANSLAEIGPKARAAVPFLVALLRDKNIPVRCSAARALYQIGPPMRILSLLIETIKDKDQSVSAYASGAVAEIGPPAVPHLIALLADEEAHVRASAAGALGSIGPEAKEAVPALIRALKEKGMGYGVAETLGRIGVNAKAAVPGLVGLLKTSRRAWPTTGWDDDARVRRTALTALVHVAPDAPETVSALVEATRDQVSDVQNTAVFLLRYVGPRAKEVSPTLLKFAEGIGAGGPLPGLACIALDEIGPESEEKSIAVLNGAGGGTLIGAVKALGRGDPESKKAVVALREALDHNGRVYAAKALWGLNKHRDLAALTLSNSLALPNRLAARFLSETGPEAKVAIPALTNALKSPDPFVRFYAAKALWVIDRQSNTVLPVLIGLLKFPDMLEEQEQLEQPVIELRGLAIQTLGDMDPSAKEAIPALIEFLVTTEGPFPGYGLKGRVWGAMSPLSRLKTVEVLPKIDPQNKAVLSTLIEALKDRDKYVRAGAAAGLGMIGPAAKQAVPALVEAIQEGEYRLRTAAAVALKEIDPQVAAKTAFR
jgi:HEAT repeat protein